jgi:ribosomal protein S18 acetylase RimI-like enzyme
MSEVVIRPARPEDLDAIVEFNCRLAEESESLLLDRPIVRPGVAAILADPAKGRYFVACAGEAVVGQMMHTREWSDWRNGDIWWLQSVYVAPEWRRKGVFRRLYEHLLRAAEADPQVVGIRLYVEEHNARALEAYRRLGMRDAGYLVMEAMLKPRRP